MLTKEQFKSKHISLTQKYRKSIKYLMDTLLNFNIEVGDIVKDNKHTFLVIRVEYHFKSTDPEIYCSGNIVKLTDDHSTLSEKFKEAISIRALFRKDDTTMNPVLVTKNVLGLQEEQKDKNISIWHFE